MNEDSTIPTRFEHAEAAQQIAKDWDQAQCAHAEVNPDRKPFTIVIPPPNVTGALHLGHGLNNTLQDMVIRTKRMQGYEALWMPGTDHAGIATQAVVERRLKENENLTRHDLGREELVKRIWDWKDQYEKRIVEQLKRMGCSCDWQRVRFTLDEQCAAAVRATFFDLFGKALIYRGKRLVNWDTFLQTAVSNDEVENVTQKGHFWHFSYPVIDPKPGEPTRVEIATTRPETMLGDTAVAVHPDPEKAFDKVAAELQAKLAEASEKEKPLVQKQIDALAKRRDTMLPGLIQLRDMANDGRMLQLPLADRPIPLIADVWAKPELGSGCVKITPAHDPNDYEVGLRVGLPMINLLNPDGTLNADAGTFEGLTIPKARKAVVAALEELELLGDIEDREIELPHSDRSKTPIEPYLADQWFVRMDELAESAMSAVRDEEVKIFPTRYRKGYLDWLGEKRDWPVSRQLWWGHQIPIWSKTGLTTDEADQLVEKINAAIGSDTDTARCQVDTADDDTRGVFVCLKTEGDPRESAIEALGLERDPDVLDTWFSSALWPHSTLGWPEKTAELEYFYPTSTLITSRDIITLWVARMVLMSRNNLGVVPFREVFIHPKILDGLGETMSKSKGNGVDPNDVIDKFGPDALRFGLARLATDTQDVRMPVQYECPACEKLIDQTKKNRSLPKMACPECKAEFSTQWAETEADKSLPKAAVVSERFETARNFVNKLWNAARFVMMNMDGYQPQSIDVDALPLEDKWLLSRLSSVTTQVTEGIEHYRFAEVSRLLYDFAWDEFCSFYVEIAKPRLADESQRALTQSVMAHGLDTLLRLLHPTMPFVTESIWGYLNELAPQRGLEPAQANRFVMTADWPVAIASHHDEGIERQFAEFQEVVGAIRKIRASQNIAPRETLPVAIRCSQSSTELLEPMRAYLEGLAGAEVISLGPDAKPFETDGPLSIPSIDIDVHVDLEKFIDIEAELARLEKLHGQLVKQITGKQQKLNNESFVSRAPAEVVQGERDSLADLAKQRESVEGDIQRLRAKSK
ncbi:Valine--tRNA ligase [Rubripirellula lacrimiformis]|uniref:Valine--tRNA ligase n=1 Tax=Rubripirellula lacrimiformis TaxID=1930273 RepID=A0A517NHF3_9BACT|nr:valine--tRNA ligase [Rubripirellula lacrimiformis]QDT06566.1 Valine--tRNA ligase [Rubripirellula lacrimiformis]